MSLNHSAIIVKCPTCKKPVPWLAEQLYKPFCCERCKLIDLGEWAMEEKRIPGESLDEFADEFDETQYH
jgi:endogenous inhibitor of DNA gyrase (YacG/DUF329 family)